MPSFEKMLSCATVNAFLACRCDQVVLYASPSISRVAGLDPSRVIGCAHARMLQRWGCCKPGAAADLHRFPRKSILELANARPEDRETLSALFEQARSAPAGPQACGHFRCKKESGDSARIEASLSSDGEFVYALLRDTESESCTEERLEAFLLSTSHDLRTPCHTIQCAAQLLAARPGVLTDAEASELLRAVRASSIVMEDTVSNVLALRHKGLPWKFSAAAREAVDVRTIFTDALEVAMMVFNPTAARCPVSCEALPQPLLGDAEALRRLFSNLVVSACHLHISGGQAAHVGRTAITRIPDSGSGCSDGDGTVGVDVTLSLSLPALPETALSSIFNPCEGVCCTALFVSRAIARAMGGDVEVANGLDHVRISARFWLHQEGAEPVGGAAVQGEPSLGESLAAIEEVCMKRAPPLTELTTRMMECMAGASQRRRNVAASA